MKSVFIARLGGPECLEMRESPDPEPGPGLVRVRARAIGINFADILMRQGLYPGAPKVPFVPGYEAAGVVDRVGPGVEAWKAGDRVIVPTNFGGYSDTLLAGAGDIFPIPDGKSFEAAAAFTVTYLTAYEALVVQGHLRAGQRVLIHGAAGGVGLAAVQVAKLFSAEIFGTASGSKHDELRRHGVAHCIDYRTKDFETEVSRLTRRRGVHVILDPVGGKSFQKSYRCLARTGKLILYGFSVSSTGPRRNVLNTLWQFLRTPRFSAFDLMMENKGVIGLHLGMMTQEKEHIKASLGELLAWWTQGKLDPVVGARYPLDQAARAHEFIQDRKNVGKVVLTA